MNRDKVFGKVLIGAIVSFFVLPIIWIGYYHLVFSPDFHGGFWEAQKLSVPLGQWDCLKEYFVSVPGLVLEIIWGAAVLFLASFFYRVLRKS